MIPVILYIIFGLITMGVYLILNYKYRWMRKNRESELGLMVFMMLVFWPVLIIVGIVVGVSALLKESVNKVLPE